MSSRRRWGFRAVILALPLVLLATWEVALRWADYGHPTSFFISQFLNGQEVLVENTWFGRRFFPPEMARSPAPVVLSARKPAGTYRIFLFGESAAMGDPRPAYGMGRYLETLLRERFPGQEFEVVCVAMTAINSHAILPIARECARLDGNLWIVYMGHNEMAGPFGANTVFGPRTPPNAVVRAYLWLQHARVGQWLVEYARRFARPAETPAKWGGMKMFLDHQLPPDDPRKTRVYRNFRGNLEAIAQAGERAGVPVVLCSVASNLRDCAPFGSLSPATWSPSELAAWGEKYRSGTNLAGQGRYTEAIKLFQECVLTNPRHAELRFWLGQCQLQTTNRELARSNLVLARDLDSLPFRADSRINALIKETAVGHADQGVVFLDVEQVLAGLAEDGLPGQAWFHEHVHLNFEGNYQVARAMAEQIVPRLPAAMVPRQTPAWAAPEACANQLGLTDWNRLTVLEEIGRRLSEPPFVQQLNQPARVKRLGDQIREIQRRLPAANQPGARSVYETALQQHPQDHWLHHNYSEFLAATGDWAGAVTHLRQVTALIPHHHAAYLHLGRTLARQNKYEEARLTLNTALRLRPDFGEAYLELGQLEAGQGRPAEALKQFELALRHRPGDATIYLHQAYVLAGQKRRDEARQSLRQAVRLRPTYWEARYVLGMDLAGEEKNGEAQKEFEEVVRLRPDHLPARLNLGAMLARQDRYDEARAQFEEVLRQNPASEKARQFLQQLDPFKSAGAKPPPSP